MLRPLSTKPVCSSKTSISSADDEGVDPMLDEVEGSGPAAFGFPERCTTSCSNQSSSEAGETANIVPSDLEEAPRDQPSRVVP